MATRSAAEALRIESLRLLNCRAGSRRIVPGYERDGPAVGAGRWRDLTNLRSGR